MNLKLFIVLVVFGFIEVTFAHQNQPNDCGLDLRSNYGADCGQPDQDQALVNEIFGTPQPTIDRHNQNIAPVPAPVPAPSPAGQINRVPGRYHGCFKDKLNRMFKRTHNFGLQATVEHCVNFCATEGFIYAGLQAKKFCFCGNLHPVDSGYAKLDESLCRLPCFGNLRQMCGGVLANSVYETGNEIFLTG